MRILLANLPWIDTDEVYGLRAGSRWPHLRIKKQQLEYYPFPFFLAYASSVLQKEGHNVTLKDCIADGIGHNDFLKFVEKGNYDLAVFETSTPSIYNDLALTEAVKGFGVKTVLTGPHVTALPKQSLKSFVDYIIIGEYEYSLRDLVNALEKGKPVDKIGGLCFRKGKKVVLNARAPLIEPLEDLPYPDRKQLPMKKYIDPFCKHTPNAQMMTSRGCPYRCIFCVEPWVYYGVSNYRMREPEKVVDEMEYLINEFGAREIYFDDSSFSVNQERVKKICDEIMKRNLKIAWSCMADAKLEKETLKDMKKSGCVAVKFGVESADPQILKNINKHINLEDVKSVVKLCKEVGIETHATYMFGLPGETHETIKKTMDFAFKLNTDTAQFSIATPYPGTKFYEMAKKNNWLVTDDWTKYQAGSDAVIEYPNLSKEELLNAANKARKRIMLKVASNPRQLIQYINVIYRYSGMRGLVKNFGEKISFLMGR